MAEAVERKRPKVRKTAPMDTPDEVARAVVEAPPAEQTLPVIVAPEEAPPPAAKAAPIQPSPAEPGSDPPKPPVKSVMETVLVRLNEGVCAAIANASQAEWKNVHCSQEDLALISACGYIADLMLDNRSRMLSDNTPRFIAALRQYHNNQVGKKATFVLSNLPCLVQSTKVGRTQQPQGTQTVAFPLVNSNGSEHWT